jgi:protein gp37
MAEQSKIEWTDHTFNPWEGCQKVAPECDNCYAEARDVRFTGGTHWGPKAPRRRTSAQNWSKPRRWNAQAEAFYATHGRRQRVFCASLADVFDNAVDTSWRDDLWALIRECDQLDWLLLTKRPQNIAKMLPPDWGDGWPHVWLGTSAGTQKTANQNIPHLLKAPAAVRFVSAEPLLGSIDFAAVPKGTISKNITICFGALTGVDGLGHGGPRIDWVICGGESGPNARPMHPDWAKSLREQCQNAGTAFFFKQWGEWQPYSEHDESNGPALHDEAPAERPDETTRNRFDAICIDSDGTEYGLGEKGQFPKAPSGAFAGPRPMPMHRIGKKAAGRSLEGREWNEVPYGCL